MLRHDQKYNSIASDQNLEMDVDHFELYKWLVWRLFFFWGGVLLGRRIVNSFDLGQ